MNQNVASPVDRTIFIQHGKPSAARIYEFYVPTINHGEYAEFLTNPKQGLVDAPKEMDQVLKRKRFSKFQSLSKNNESSVE